MVLAQASYGLALALDEQAGRCKAVLPPGPLTLGHTHRHPRSPWETTVDRWEEMVSLVMVADQLVVACSCLLLLLLFLAF